MQEAALAEDQDQLLRARRVPDPQGRRPPEHLLPVQRIHGGAAGGNGRSHSG